ncbi:hypothetical protein K8942_02350 [Candidatus Peribacteria bacterium]|nr:MAG: hypothetical protein K8942_02350 [Candidatus Peribacteria bacterium]
MKGAVKEGQPFTLGIPEDDARLFGFTTGITLEDAIKQIAPLTREFKKVLLTNIEGTIEALALFAPAAA